MRCGVWLACGVVAWSGCDALFHTEAPVIVDADLTRPIFLAASYTHDGAVTSKTFDVTVPPAAKLCLIVSVGVGGSGPSNAAIATITYNGAPLTPFIQISDAPNTSSTTLTQQWHLVAPDVGTHPVVVTLTPGVTLHVSAMVFGGVNQDTPVRAIAQMSGNGSSSEVTLQSATTDLVESVVGHGGNGISAAGLGQIARFIDNNTSLSSLDNAAGSTASGAPTVTMSWTMTSNDVWQEVAASLQP